MPRGSVGQLILFTLGIFATSLPIAGTAWAQAWVPPKKGGSADFVYARGKANEHIFSTEIFNPVTGVTDNQQDLGEEVVNTYYLRFDYGITGRLAVSGDVAYVSARFDAGDYQQFYAETELDDALYHGTMQDFRVELRYLVVQRGGFVLTPSAGVVIPTHDYEPEGHAAPGRHLTQVPIAVNAGYVWPRYIHTTYVEGRYAYSFLKSGDYDFSRTNSYAEAGTYLTTSLSVRGVVGAEWTHGGVDWASALSVPEEFEVHDQQTSSSYWSAGIGASYEFGQSAGVSLNYSQILSGENVVNTKLLNVTLSWYFGGPQVVKSSAPSVERGARRIASFSPGDLLGR